MNMQLKKAAQLVQDVLNNNNLECKVLELPSSTRTAIEAANAIGCEVDQIAKSLIFRTVSGQPVLVLVSGPNRVNEKTIASYLGEKIEKADADFTREVTGFAIGGIPPVGHKQKITNIFIDEDLLNFDSVWAAAGTPNAVFELPTKHLLDITSGKVVSVK